MLRRFDFRMLGSLEVVDGAGPIELGGPKQRALLAVLLLRAGEPVAFDALIDAIWPERAPATASTSIQGYVSHLRRLLGADAIVTEGRAYRLAADPEQVDSARFERELDAARAAGQGGDFAGAAARACAALELWRGPALADFRFDEFAQAEARRLDELRLVATEERIAAELELGRAPELVGELRTLIGDHPLRERLRRHLMLALYRSARQAEALEAYRDARAALDKLGLEPSAELQELERAILNHDAALDAAAAPAARGGRRRPPAAATPIVGRRAELETVRQLLAEPGVRLLTLTGAGGTGKTRLSLEVLQTLDEDYGDGTAFVPLAPVDDPARLVPAIAQALDVREGAGEELGDALRSFLRDRHMLIVLDNFEQVTTGAEQLPPMLGAAPRLQLLVTSRSALRLSAEHELPVPPLTREDAFELLVARARASRPGFDPAGTEPELAEICARLDDLPLAIELAAPRLKLLTPAAMLTRLEERLRLLTGGARDLPARQQTLRSTLDWSHDLLEPDEQLLFARLSVFVGGCTLESAEAVCGPDLDVFDLVASLVDKSLVRMRDTRVTMLQTIREYAGERLRERGEAEELAARHAAHYADLARTAQPELIRADQVRWLDRLEVEHDNLRATLEWLAAQPDPTEYVEVAGLLWRFWQTHGHLTEGAAWLERALAADPPACLATAHGLNAAGCLADSRGRYAEAIAYHERAVALYEQLDYRRGRAWSLNNLALAFADSGECDRAEELHEQALELAREIDEAWLVASSLINLSNIAFRRCDYERAEPLQEEGRQRSRALGDSWREALACLNLGWIHVQQGDAARGAARLQESVELFERLGERRHLPDALEGLAAVAAERGDPERSARLFGGSHALRQAIGVPAPAAEERICERFIGAARQQLGDDAYEQENAAGGALPVDDLIRFALAPGAGVASTRP